MWEKLQARTIRFLRWSEKYTKTDMVYLAHGGFWLFIGQVGSIVFSLGLAIIFGHFATQDTYGNYKYIINIGSLLTALSLSGLGTTVVRAAARHDEGSLKQAFSLNLRWSGGMILAGLIASAYYFYVGNTFAAIGLALAAVTLPLINGFSLYDSFLVGIKEFRLDTMFSIGSLAFTTLALVVTLLFFSQRAIILVAVYFIANLSSDALWYYLTLKRTRNDKTDPEMLSYGFHLSVMGVIGAVADKIDSIVIFSILGPAQLAVYTYAIAIPEQFKNVLKNIVPLSMPKFAQRSIREIRGNIYVRMWYLSLGVGATMALYIMLSPVLFHILFPVYIASIPYSQLYALSILFTVPGPLVVSILQAHRKTRELYVASNVGPIILLIVLPVLTYYWGIEGAILSQIIYRFVNMCAALWPFMRLKD